MRSLDMPPERGEKFSSQSKSKIIMKKFTMIKWQTKSFIMALIL